jgi:hypothetical protein
METKRCLFCDRIVPIKSDGEYDCYIGCCCAPAGGYMLKKDGYEAYQSAAYHTKRELFPLISGYIREMTDCGEKVALSGDDLHSIGMSPQIPATIEEKGTRLLRYLHRHASGPYEPVVIHRLTESFNLTYSPNLQELIYIIEKLKDEQYIERAGSTFRLTELGWKEAAARSEGQRLKPCFVYLPGDEGRRSEWMMNVFPKLEQCGYFPRYAEASDDENAGDQMLRMLPESKLFIVDMTEPTLEMSFAAGFALGIELPVIWTMRKGDGGMPVVQSDRIRPIVYERTEDLAALLQQRLS